MILLNIEPTLMFVRTAIPAEMRDLLVVAFTKRRGLWVHCLSDDPVRPTRSAENSSGRIHRANDARITSYNIEIDIVDDCPARPPVPRLIKKPNLVPQFKIRRTLPGEVDTEATPHLERHTRNGI